MSQFQPPPTRTDDFDIVTTKVPGITTTTGTITIAVPTITGTTVITEDAITGTTIRGVTTTDTMARRGSIIVTTDTTAVPCVLDRCVFTGTSSGGESVCS